MRRLYGCWAAVLVLLSEMTAGAAVIHVPAGQPTIQAGIDAASAGDSVLVADGTYSGDGNRNLNFCGKAIRVASEHGPEVCIIDCTYAGPSVSLWGFVFISGETHASRLDGFTIRNIGYGATLLFDGAGIYCYASSPTISNCIIQGNFIFPLVPGAAGVFCEASSPVFEDCTFDWNIAGMGSIYLHDSSPSFFDCRISNSNRSGIDSVNGELTLINCVISDNLDGGINFSGTGAPGSSTLLMVNCTLSGNSYASGVNLGNAIATICNSLITGNVSFWVGGGASCWGSSEVTFSNCTIADNSAPGEGCGIICYDSAAISVLNTIIQGNQNTGIILHDQTTAEVSFSDVQAGFPGPGNFDADPGFAAGPLGAYYLSQTAAGQAVNSPCLNAGSSLAEELCYPAAIGMTCMNRTTTRTDEFSDQGRADVGFHYLPPGFAPATFTPARSRTATPTASLTPTPEGTQAVTPTPTAGGTQPPTRTASPETTVPPPALGVSLAMPAGRFHTGDRCWLMAHLYSDRFTPLYGVPFVVVLDLEMDVYWFYPNWVEYPPTLDYELIVLRPGAAAKEIVPIFSWPAHSGVYDRAHFYAAMLRKDLAGLYGTMGVWDFGWEE